MATSSNQKVINSKMLNHCSDLNKIKNHSNVPLYISSFVLPLIFLLIGFSSGHFAPFGEKDVISASGDSNYYSYYYELYDHVHSPELFVSNASSDENISNLTETNSISGNNYITDIAYHISDPSNFIILLFDRDAIPTVFNILYLIKIALCSLFFCIFLTHHNQLSGQMQKLEESENDCRTLFARESLAKAAKKKKSEQNQENNDETHKKKKDFIIGFVKSPKSKFGSFLHRFDFLSLSFSIVFSCSQFLISKGMNPAYTLAIAVFPLLMLGLDQIFYQKKWIFFSLIWALEFYLNIHIALICGVFVFIYSLLLNHKNLSQFFTFMATYLKACICSLLLAAVELYLAGMNPDFHKDFNLTFPAGNTTNSIWQICRQLASRVVPNKAQPVYTSVDLYIGVIFLLIFVLYNLNTKISLKEKLKKSLFMLALFSGAMLNTSNFLFNGFYFKAVPTLYYGFTISFLALSMAYDLFRNLQAMKKWTIHIAFIFSLAIIILPIIFTKYDSSSPVIISLEFIIVYYLLTILFRCNSMTFKCYLALLSLLAAFEVGGSMSKNLSNLGNGFFIFDHESSNDYREYEFAKTILEKHPGSKLYLYSTDSLSVDPLLMNLEGYDYLICQSSDIVDSHYEEVASSTYYKAYRNKQSMKYVFLAPGTLSYSFDYTMPFYSINTIARGILYGNNIYAQDKGGNIDYSYSGDAKENAYNFVADQKGTYYAYYNTFAYLGELNALNGRTTIQKESKNSSNYYVADIDLEALEEINTIQSQLISNVMESGDTIQIRANQDGYVLINSNKCVEQGEKIGNYNFLGNYKNALILPVHAGENTFVIRGNQIKPLIYILISCLGLLLIIAKAFTKKTSNRTDPDDTDSSDNADDADDQNKQFNKHTKETEVEA